MLSQVQANATDVRMQQILDRFERQTFVGDKRLALQKLPRLPNKAAPAMPAAAGYVVFGTPPVASADQMGEAFLPNPAMNVGFTASVGPEEARAYAASFTAPRSAISLDEFIADIVRTGGEARAGLFGSSGESRFADEVAIASTLRRPLAILHGEGEQLVNLDYLR